MQRSKPANSIAHSLGSLNRLQRQAKDVSGNVKAIGITVLDNHLESGPSTLAQIGSAARIGDSLT